jgi:3-methylcrotonyl-CoA carboxylase alpha subunit
VKLIARHDGNDVEVEVQRQGSGYRVRLGDRWVNVDFVSLGRYVRSIRMEDGTQLSFVHHREGNTHYIALDGSTLQVEVVDPLALKRRRREDETGGGGGVVKAMMPGRVVRVLVSKGDTVRKGTGLLILEAMKMENEITAPADGVVDEIFVEPGRTVEASAELLHLSPL